MFTIDDQVANTGAEAVTLYPYGAGARATRRLMCKASTFCMRA